MRAIVTRILPLLAVLVAGPASAAGGAEGPALRIQAELQRGRNYADARGPSTADVADVLARAQQRTAALNAGRNYADAGRLDSQDDAAIAANARRHELAMNRGLDHESARSAVNAR